MLIAAEEAAAFNPNDGSTIANMGFYIARPSDHIGQVALPYLYDR